MNKLEVGMKFTNLRQAFQFLGIESEYFGAHKSKELKFSEFCNWHRINKHSLVIDEVFENRKSLYHEQKTYTLDDLRNNFVSLYEDFGRVLTYNEFIDNTNISLTTYCNKLNLSNQVYETLIGMYLSEEIKNEYLQERKEFWKEIGSTKGVLNFIKHSEDDLKNNFKQIFDYYYKNYNSYPTRRVFNAVSKIDESSYRKRLNKKWSELCEYYGYKIENRLKNEYLALEICKKLLKTEYTAQKTFEWLVNETKHHLFCDGYFENLNLVIEFDGAMHRTPVKAYGGQKRFERQKHNDYIKNKLLKEHDITVIRIDSRLNWYTEEGMLKILQSEFSKNNLSYNFLAA